jgi:hypothetical protein
METLPMIMICDAICRMPFIIVPVAGGFKVKKNVPGGEMYSKKPLTKAVASKQLKAIYRSENLKHKYNGSSTQ